MEAVDGATYRRTFDLDGRHGVLSVRPDSGAAQLVVDVEGVETDRLPEMAERLVRQFDLAAEPEIILPLLGRDPLLAPLVAERPGLRIPGAWDPFELAMRAILGQQISVAAARSLAVRLVARHGTPLDPGIAARTGAGLTHVFPGPAALLAADPAVLGIPRTRATTIARFAAEALADPFLLDPGQPLSQAIERLCALPGIGPWTAHYIALRGLAHRDAFPAGDLGLRKAAGASMPSARELEARAEAWRPWRAYAAMHLWNSL